MLHENELKKSEIGMVSEKKNGMITYRGFDEANNGKFIVETKGNWTYVNFQENEFSQVIFGYVVKQDDEQYKAFQLGNFESNFADRNVKYFDSVEDGIGYIKSLKYQ